MSNEDIAKSVQETLQKVGLGILDDPIRFEAFLRDFHPEKPAEVSVLTESLNSGSVHQFLRRVPLHECTASLSARGGIAPRYADWAMQLWADILPASAMLEQQDQIEQISKRWEGSVEEVLGQYRGDRK